MAPSLEIQEVRTLGLLRVFSVALTLVILSLSMGCFLVDRPPFRSATLDDHRSEKKPSLLLEAGSLADNNHGWASSLEQKPNVETSGSMTSMLNSCLPHPTPGAQRSPQGEDLATRPRLEWPLQLEIGNDPREFLVASSHSTSKTVLEKKPHYINLGCKNLPEELTSGFIPLDLPKTSDCQNQLSLHIRAPRVFICNFHLKAQNSLRIEAEYLHIQDAEIVTTRPGKISIATRELHLIGTSLVAMKQSSISNSPPSLAIRVMKLSDRYGDLRIYTFTDTDFADSRYQKAN